MAGATKVINLKIALLLFLHLPLPPLTLHLAGLDQESTHCHSLKSVFFLEGFCTSPGSLMWPLSLGTIPRRHCSLALAVKVTRRSRMTGVDPGFQSKCLYPVVTGCEEMDWSHVSHILTPLTPSLLCSFSCSSTFAYFRCRLGGWRWEGQRGHRGRSDGASLSLGGGKSVKHQLYRTESGRGGAQWRLRGSPDSGRGDIRQFTLGVQERTEVCVCVCVCVLGGVYLFPWERVGGFHCVTETLVNISSRLPPRKQQGCTVTQASMSR